MLFKELKVTSGQCHFVQDVFTTLTNTGSAPWQPGKHSLAVGSGTPDQNNGTRSAPLPPFDFLNTRCLPTV